MARELDQSNLVKDELEDKFIFSFIHDLKNMMVPIMSRAEMLQLPGINEERRKDMVQQIVQNCGAMLDVMNKMVGICKNRNSLEAYTPKTLNLFNLVSEAFDVVSEAAERKEITLSLSVAEDLAVYADREAVLGVIVNLLGNAVKFTPRGGNVEALACKTGTDVTVSVSDSGVGLDELKIANLLENNKYFHTPGTEGELGSGLGLLLCDSHLRRGGSKLKFANNPNGGATFSFVLPTSLQA